MQFRNRLIGVLCVLLAGFAPGLISFAQDEADIENSKDHPMFSRMKNFYIVTYETNFDAVEFYLSDENTETVEGQKTYIEYYLKEGSPIPSELQIRRNYGNAVKQLGGQILYEKGDYASFKIVKNNREIWFAVNVYYDGTEYTLTFLEKSAMAQEVTANDMLTALNKDGYIALYIQFDTGKFDVKPESLPIIDQIAALLTQNQNLKLSIEGHTDNVGTPQSNKTLSDQRAKAVMKAITGKGIDAGRLSAAGWGQEKPVADNRTEDGRAKNRRVELVKQ
jgi:OOP family OmpA-OmpF porin